MGLLGGALGGLLGNVVGGIFGNSGSRKAQDALVKGYQQGADSINGFYNEAKGYMQPYMNTGIIANNGIQALLGGDYSGFYNSPDFKAAMRAGGDMLDNSAASRGGLFGGGHQKELTNYGQQLASQYLGNYRNFLGGVYGQGQSAATNLGQFGANAGQSLANLYANMGQARANGYGERASNNSNILGSLIGAFF